MNGRIQWGQPWTCISGLASSRAVFAGGKAHAARGEAGPDPWPARYDKHSRHARRRGRAAMSGAPCIDPPELGRQAPPPPRFFFGPKDAERMPGETRTDPCAKEVSFTVRSGAANPA